MNLMSLFATITLDTTDFGDGIQGVNTKMLQAKKNIENVGAAVKSAAKTFAAIGAGVGAVGTAVFSFANSVSSTGDDIDKMSQKLGMSAEAYQEWSHILEHCGASIDSMQTSMKTLATAAETGNDAFEKLGLTQQEIAGMDQEELFSATIAALQNVSSETERTYLAGQLLGRGATELGPLLNTSAEEIESMRQNLHEMGAVMSDEAVKNGAAFKDSLTNLKAAFSGASNELGSGLVPKITTLMDKITAFIADGGLDRLITGFGNLAPVLTGAAAAMVTFKASSAIAGVITAVTKAVDGQAFSFKALSAAMNASPFALIATLIASVGTALVTLYVTNEDFRVKVQAIWEKIQGFFSGAWEGIRSVWDEVKPYFELLWDSIKTIFSVVESVLSGDFSGAWEAIKDNLSGWADHFEGIWEDIKGVFANAKDAFKTVGKNIVGGVKQGILDAWTNFKNWVVDKFNGLVSSVKQTLGIASPSKVFASIGGYMAEGLGEGWESEYSQIRKDIESGLQFKPVTVDYESSSVGRAASDIGSQLAPASAGSSGESGPITINLVTPNGHNLASWLIPYLKDYSRAYGVSPI